MAIKACRFVVVFWTLSGLKFSMFLQKFENPLTRLKNHKYVKELA